MSADDHDGPSVETLIKEVSDGLGGPVFPSRPPVDTEPLFKPRGIYRCLALAAAALGDSDGGYSGTEFIADTKSALGYAASSGTIYPLLHDLEDEGLIARRKYVQSERCTVNDAVRVDAELARYEARLWWFLHTVRTARERLDESRADTDAVSETDATE